MAYRYNELTGEFEDIPEDNLRPPSQSGRASSSQTFRPTVPTRQSTASGRPVMTTPSRNESSLGSKVTNWLSGFGFLILRVLPYVAISAMISMCN